MEAFRPRYLSAEQVAEIMERYKQAAEAKCLELWVNHQCNPNDAVHEAAYQAACRDLAWLESEEERWDSRRRQD